MWLAPSPPTFVSLVVVETWVTRERVRTKLRSEQTRPPCLRFLKWLTYIMPYASRTKRGRREGSRTFFSRREHRHSPGSPRLPQSVTEDKEVSFPGFWLGTWKSAKERTTVLRGASQDEAAGTTRGSENCRSSYAEARWGQFAKRHCWPLPEVTTGIIHAQNKTQSTADIHKTNPEGESRLSTPYHNTAQSSGAGTEMTSTRNEEIALFAYSTLLL